MKRTLTAFLDPATNMGTARWVALGVAAYDVIKNGTTLANGAVLLVLAGIEIAGRYFTMPPAGPSAVPA